MATWHQMRGGRKLTHSTQFHLCVDPPGQMSYGYLFPTQTGAETAREAMAEDVRRHAFILQPEFAGRAQFASISIREPAHGKHRGRYQAALDAALDHYTGFLAINPTRNRCTVRVEWRGHCYRVVAGFHDTFSGGFCPISFARTGEAV
jgi:hypothetical protein